MEVGLGVMAYLAVLHETGSHLLAGLAFSVGLIAVLLAHSELFTEDFHMPVMALVTRQASIWKLLRLWAGTLGSNLVGGWVIMWLVMQAFPEWRSTVAESAHHFVDAPFSLQTVCLALLGGSTMTLMTRMQKGAKTEIVRVVAAIGGGSSWPDSSSSTRFWTPSWYSAPSSPVLTSRSCCGWAGSATPCCSTSWAVSRW